MGTSFLYLLKDLQNDALKCCFVMVPVSNKMKTLDSIAGMYFLFSLTMSASEDLFRPHNRHLKCQKVHQARDIENIDWWGWCVNNKLWVNLRQIKNKILLNVPTNNNFKPTVLPAAHLNVFEGSFLPSTLKIVSYS